MNFKDTENFKAFLELYNSNPDRVIFFVGAGLSLPLFPSWATFLKQLVTETHNKGKLVVDKAELLKNLDNGEKFLEIADFCASAIGTNEYREIIEKHFDKVFQFDDIPNAYKALLTLEFKSIITTNYDRIPEIGGKGAFSCYSNKNIPEALKAIEKGKKIVLKIHGDILNQDSIILTQEDFKNIIHNNLAVQNAIRSIFSTSTICFVGFGLTDPHFNLILDFLSAINNGQPILHYALLTAKSKFEILSIEKRTGIRVIEYSPSNTSHPEVEEFLNLLKGIKSTSAPTNKIDTVEELLSAIESKIQSNLGIFNFYISYNHNTKAAVINYFTRARTEYEQQREIVSIFKLFDFETEILESIKLCCFVESDPNIEFIKFAPIILVCSCSFSVAQKLCSKSISEIDFWKQIKFNQPYMVGNIHFVDRGVDFPYINF